MPDDHELCPCMSCQLQRLPSQWRAAHATANQKDSPSISIECASELEAVIEDARPDPTGMCECAWCALRFLPVGWTGHATAWQGLATAPTYEQCADDLQALLEDLGVIPVPVRIRTTVPRTGLRELDDFGLDANEFADQRDDTDDDKP